MKSVNTSGEVKQVYLGVGAGGVSSTWVNKARKRYWLASYVLPDKLTLDLMESKAKRGKVDVRLVVSAVTTETLPTKEYPHIKMKRVATDKGTMHAKFIVVDDSVLTGSSNWNDFQSINVVVRLRGPVVKHFAGQFNKLWKLKTGAPLLRGTEAKALITKVVEKNGWSDFLTTVAKRSEARGYLTVKEQAALERALK